MKHKTKSGILVLVLLLAIGFASVTTSLVINGTGIFATNEDDFEIVFTKAKLDDVDVSGSVISSDGKSITYTTNELTKIGDTSKLEFTVTNNSTQYDASVQIECKANGEKSNYYEILPDFVEEIKAKTSENGTITTRLKINTTEEIEETFTCTITASAIERTEVVELSTYRLTGTLVDESNTPIQNANLVVYSKTPTYVTTNEEGYFKVTGLETGVHELYYVENKTIEELEQMEKSEVKDIATSSAIFSTTSETTIIASNGYKITEIKIKDEQIVSEYKVGDPITIDETEVFNVISQTDDTITMLAQYNLGTDYKQSEDANKVIFSQTSGWSNRPAPQEIDIQVWSTNPKKYVNEYVSYLQGELKDDNLTGTLITLTELKQLGCPIDEDYTYTGGKSCANSSNSKWLVNGQFWWTRSTDSKYDSYVWFIYADGYISNNYCYYDRGGIRPVITVSKETLEDYLY